MIQIGLPYPEAAAHYRLWAHREGEIDFRREPAEGVRCTLSFAAEELVRYLQKLGLEAEVSNNPAEPSVILSCKAEEGEGFTFRREGDRLEVIGDGRAGALYGVYELLEQQGIRWPSPWEETIPPRRARLQYPSSGRQEPSMPLGRGFDFEGPLKESEELYLWMARNKLNLSAYRPHTGALQRKLCMSFKAGGHIFERILDPNRPTESGGTLLSDHPDWFGQREEPITAENAQYVQFCMSNPELREELFAALLSRLQGEWEQADRVDIWGFDTWGSTCSCERCRRLGNGADQTLAFLSDLRSRLNGAMADGRLDHPVRLVMCAYEGTATIAPPKGKVPENLQRAGDYVVFYPILRCYRHDFDDPACSYHKEYRKLLRGWKGLPVMVGEYYNVSRFEDLPLVFSERIARDLPAYRGMGVTGMTYMHLPLHEWGVRTLNQVLYSKLCWNTDADPEELKQQYFKTLYGEGAEQVSEAYQYIEKAGAFCSSWRAWGRKSVLSALLDWDGKTVDAPLFRDDHLGQNAVELGECTVSLLTRAKEILRKAYEQAESAFAREAVFCSGVPVNPTDTRFHQQENSLGNRLAEDLRGVEYGIDVFSLMTAFVAYYEALEQGETGEEAWSRIRRLCRKMRGYCYSVKYTHPLPGVRCVDALERSGLNGLYDRCLGARGRHFDRGSK